MKYCDPRDIACRIRALELFQRGSLHPPLTVTYPEADFSFNALLQALAVPAFTVMTLEILGPRTVLVAAPKLYAHHLPTGMNITGGIRVSSTFPGSGGLTVQLYSDGLPFFPVPVALTGGSTLFTPDQIISTRRTPAAGSRIEIEIASTPASGGGPPTAGFWRGLAVDFIGTVIPGSGINGLPPENIQSPLISGPGLQGTVLLSLPGIWINSPTSFIYQWYVGGNLVPDAHGSSYQITAEDAGRAIQLLLTAKNQWGSGSAWSNLVVAGTGPNLAGLLDPPGEYIYDLDGNVIQTPVS